MTSTEEIRAKAQQFYGNTKRADQFVAGFVSALNGKPAPKNPYAYAGWTVGYDERKAREEV